MSRILKTLAVPTAFALLCATSGAVYADRFDDMDNNKDGKLSRAEFDQGEIAFRAADTNGDGGISKAEFAKVAKEAAAEDPKVTSVKKQLIQLSGSLRSHLVRHDEYPATLAGLVEKGLLKEIPKDPWDREFQYKLVEKKGGNDGMGERGVRIVRGNKTGAAAVETKPKPNSKTFEILSAGADGQFGNADDILKTEDGLRLSLTPAQKEAILSEAGDEYKLSQRAYAWEQAYRLWLAIAEHEYSKGEPAKELGTLTLPVEAFPSGKAVDIFARPLDLRTVRGLRAVCAALMTGDKEELTYTESEFVSVLQARLVSINNGGDYRLNQAHRAVQSFWQSKGRLPLTMKELTASSTDRWFNRGNYGHPLIYVTCNDDKGYAIFDLGQDNSPGGLEENMDSVSYGPSDVTASGQNAASLWAAANDQRKRYEGVQKAIQEALKRKEDEEAKKAAEAEKAAADKAAAAEKEGAEKEAPKGEAKPGDTPAPGDGEKPAPAPATPPAAPAAPEAPKPAEQASFSFSANWPTSVRTLSPVILAVAPRTLGSSLHLLSAQVAPQPAQPAQPAAAPPQPAVPPVGGPAPAAGGPAPGQPEAPQPAEPASEKALKTAADMIPLKLFDEIEARELSMISDDDWRWSSLNYQVRQLAEQCSSYLQSGDRKTMPWGNVDLPRNKEFLTSLGEHWRGGNDEYLSKQFGKQVWCIARFEKGEFNAVKRAVAMVLPAKGRNDVIIVFRRDGNEITGPFFGDPQGQPSGWWAEMATCDAEPGVAVEAAAEKPAAEKPADPEKDAAEKDEKKEAAPAK